MSKYRQFQAELQKLHEQSERERRAGKVEALRRILALIAEYDLQPHELGLDLDPPRRTAGGVARFRDPLTNRTWSGRGRPPQWLDGQDRTKFAID